MKRRNFITTALAAVATIPFMRHLAKAEPVRGLKYTVAPSGIYPDPRNLSKNINFAQHPLLSRLGNYGVAMVATRNPDLQKDIISDEALEFLMHSAPSMPLYHHFDHFHHESKIMGKIVGACRTEAGAVMVTIKFAGPGRPHDYFPVYVAPGFAILESHKAVNSQARTIEKIIPMEFSLCRTHADPAVTPLVFDGPTFDKYFRGNPRYYADAYFATRYGREGKL